MLAKLSHIGRCIVRGRVCSHRSDKSEATRDETPETITTAFARLEPVPPEDDMVTSVNKTRGSRPRALLGLRPPVKHSAP